MKKREMRKITAAMFAGVLTLSMLTGCGGGANQTVGSVEAAQAGGQHRCGHGGQYDGI